MPLSLGGFGRGGVVHRGTDDLVATIVTAVRLATVVAPAVMTATVLRGHDGDPPS